MATYSWFAPGGGDFTVASNWTLDGIDPAPTAPGPNDIAEFNSATTGTISGNPDVFEIFPNSDASNLTFTGQSTLFGIDIRGTLTLASGASITASGGLGVAVAPGSSGTLIVGPGASYYGTFPAQTANTLFNIGNGADSTGTVIVQGPGAVVDTGGNPAAIAALSPTGTGSLEISGGGVAKFGTTDPAVALSVTVGRLGAGTVAVDGAGSLLQLTGAMYAGRAGTGTVTLTNGASLTETAVGTGFASNFGAGGGNPFLTGGTGTLNVLSGSTAAFGDSLGFGVNGATGVGLVSDGTLNVGGLLRVGSGTTVPGGKGTLTIKDGGTVHDTAAADTSTAYVLLGATAGTNGTATVDGWGSLLDAASNAIDVGAIGTGSLTASDDGLITSTGLTVGDRGDGTLDLTSGAAAIAKRPSGTGAALTVGAQAGSTGSISVSGHGATLIAVGKAVLGGTNTGSGITAGGTGNVSVSQGGLLGTGSLTIESGSSLGIDSNSAALIAGNLSDVGGITTSGLLAVTGAVSGAGSFAVDGGLTNLGSLDSTNVSFGGAPAALRLQALSGMSSVFGMQVGDVIDLAGQHRVVLKDDTVTTKSGMLFLSAAPAGDTYRLIHSLDGTAVVLVPVSEHGTSDMVTADPALPFAGLDDMLNISADLLERLGVRPDMSSHHFTANDETLGNIGAAAGTYPNAEAVNLLMAHQSSAG